MSDDDQHLREQTVSRETVFRGRLLEVRRDRIRLPDGGEATREFIVHPGAVMIVPLLDDGEFLDLVLIEPDELDRLCASGAVTDAKTLIGLQWLQNWRSGRWAIDGFPPR